MTDRCASRSQGLAPCRRPAGHAGWHERQTGGGGFECWPDPRAAVGDARWPEITENTDNPYRTEGENEMPKTDMGYDVVPVNDLLDHDVDGTCVCGPESRLVKSESGDRWITVHNSLDGRELRE